MEDHDNIIVFRHFDNAIDASIVKTKLDAYGVPCFLTEENMSNLYPGQPFIAFKVRLHLFEHDKTRAQQILSENSLTIDLEGAVKCPICHSTRIERSFPRRLKDSLKIAFFGVLFPHEKVNHCIDCDTEF